ncbi:MAG: hypothetical protein P1U40_10280 [Coxiellaceae bacterium]|nr:hypothetical protein [Coxiellaceae bacterium]
MRRLIAFVLLCLPLCLLSQTIHLQYPLGKRAKAVLKQLPIPSEFVKAWPYDDELWLHHDGSHLLAMELPINASQNYRKLFKTIDREFKYYALYRLSPAYLLVVMSRARPIPWASDPALSTTFIADQRLMHQLYALHDRTLKQIDLNQVGKVLPLHLLYPSIANSRYSRFTPPITGNGVDWRRLAMVTALGDREAMLSVSTGFIRPSWKHLSFAHRQYVLGIAMLANAMMQQYYPALLLWDTYGGDVFAKHPPALDIVLLRNYCLHQLNRMSRKKSHQIVSLKTG